MLPGLRRLTAPNPSHHTYRGTNTYLIGEGEVAILDPGPDIAEHAEAVLRAVAGEKVVAILLTHTHRDHYGACAALKAATNAPTFAFGPQGAARIRTDLGSGSPPGNNFRPDQQLRDGESVAGRDWTLDAVHTPGHASNHLCFGFREQLVLLSGDHVMGWSSTIVSPPDGDLGSYMASLRKLLERADQSYYPGHGELISRPHERVAQLLALRLHRRAEIETRLLLGDTSIPPMLDALYAHIDAGLRNSARQMIFAHLLELEDLRLARFLGPPSTDAMVVPTDALVAARRLRDQVPAAVVGADDNIGDRR